MEERLFTEIQLRRYDGERDLMYIAYQGVVYDITECPHWRTGIHQGQHFPGQDLTDEIKDAPHGSEVFHHPNAKIVGRLTKA